MVSYAGGGMVAWHHWAACTRSSVQISVVPKVMVFVNIYCFYVKSYACVCMCLLFQFVLLSYGIVVNLAVSSQTCCTCT